VLKKLNACKERCHPERSEGSASGWISDLRKSRSFAALRMTPFLFCSPRM
jgi:hypothetical protein